MNLISISFENFRSFKDRVEIPPTYITYLIGPNGAGKSNVFKGIKTMAEIITSKYQELKDEDCFDQNLDAITHLSFTAELSLDERYALLKKTDMYDREDLDIGPDMIFQYVKYEISFKKKIKDREQISLSDRDGEFHVVHYLHSHNPYQLGSLDLAGINLHRMDGQNFETRDTQLMNTKDLMQGFDPELYNAMVKIWSSLAYVPNTRQAPSATNAAETTSVSDDGRDLPNELRTLDNDRNETKKLEALIKDLSSNEIIEIAVQLRQQSHVITVAVRGLEKKVEWDRLSSGEQNMIILAYILYRTDKTVIMTEEPEIHLHSKAQKKLLEIMRKIPHDRHILIETHSPIFASVTDDESVVLLTRDNGASGAVRVDASNCNLLRTEMGISHTDAVANDRLCFVEGESEHIAIPAFARTMGYEMGLAPWTWSLGGQGNTKNIGVLLQYLSTPEKTMFLLLDAHSEAQTHVKDLLKKKLLREDQYHILNGNFEDLFPTGMLIEHTRKLAIEKGVNFTMTEQDLEAARQGCSVIEVLDKKWRELTQKKYPKADLAKSLTVLDRDEIPDEVTEVVQIVMEKFGMVGPSRDEGSG